MAITLARSCPLDPASNCHPPGGQRAHPGGDIAWLVTRYDDTRAVPADPRVADALASLATLPRFPQCHIDLTAFAVDAGLRGIAGLRRIPLPHDDESTVLLSATLDWIATRLFDLGRHTDALAANGEAIELQRDLAGRAERQLVSPATVGTVIGGR